MAPKNSLTKDFIQSIYPILKDADYMNILGHKFQKSFFSSKPEFIIVEYFAYLDKLKEKDSPLTNTISIEDKISSQGYTSIYKFYHDLKVSASSMICESDLGSDDYLKVDAYYKFATELILNEASRAFVNLDEFKNSAIDAEKKMKPSDFAEGITADFDKISTSFKLSNDEALFVMAGQNGALPLFSSLTKKSELDPCEYSVPAPFNTIKIIPNSASVSSPSLGFVSNNPDSRIPNPALPPTEITRQIFHPNWFLVPSNSWLATNSATSFIPLIDDTVAAISLKNKGSVYFEQLGLKKLIKAREEIKAKEKSSGNGSKANGVKENGFKENGLKDTTDTNDTEIHTETDKIEAEIIDTEDSKEKMKSNAKEEKLVPGTLDIKVKNLFEWSPNSLYEDDEIEAMKKGEEQKFVSKLLIDLNKLRFERYASGNFKNDRVSKPSAKERKLYFKAKRLLEIMVSNLKPSDIVDTQKSDSDNEGLKLSKDIPVLSMNYPGVLQAPLPMQNINRYTGRLTSLQSRTYKKRK